MTTSDAWTAASSSCCGCAPFARRSMPTSRIASTTAGFTSSAGAEPAECTTTRSPPWCTRKAAAICDRPALCTHTNSTSGRSSVMTGLLEHVRVEEADQPERDDHADELHHDEHRR